jgi:CoA:oxalate CoA-transferase
VPNDGLLDGLRVLDLTQNLSGPYGAMLLADMGADVVKLEPPTGDPHRRLIPVVDGTSLLFASVNRNKRSIVVDLKCSEGRTIAVELAKSADVMFNNFRPGVMGRLGLGYADVAAHNDRLVYCSLSGFGQTGPRATRPAYDLVIQAMGGGMSLTGYPGTPPARAGIPISDLCGGAFAVIATLAALTRRGISGRGGEVETSLLDCQISMLTYWAALGLGTDEVPGPQGGGNSINFPYGPMRASDGYVVVAVYGDTFWSNLCTALGQTSWISDDRFSVNARRVENRALLQGMLDDEFARHTVAEWIDILEHYDIPAAPINDVRLAMSDPQVVARDLLLKVRLGDSEFGFAGNPIKETPPTPTRTISPPRLGQHTREILSEWTERTQSDIDGLFAKCVVSGE